MNKRRDHNVIPFNTEGRRKAVADTRAVELALSEAIAMLKRGGVRHLMISGAIGEGGFVICSHDMRSGEPAHSQPEVLRSFERRQW